MRTKTISLATFWPKTTLVGLIFLNNFSLDTDSDIDEGGGNMNTKLGRTSGGLGSGLGSGSGTSGNQNTPSFGNGAKLGGFGGAGGFGSIGANAPYGGAFINSGIPERVGSTPASDLSLVRILRSINPNY